jgi:hypothetical protein
MKFWSVDCNSEDVWCATGITQEAHFNHDGLSGRLRQATPCHRHLPNLRSSRDDLRVVQVLFTAIKAELQIATSTWTALGPLTRTPDGAEHPENLHIPHHPRYVKLLN